MSLGDKLRRLLFDGPTTSKLACERLRVSQSTFSRLCFHLADRLVPIGRGRNTRYALRRRIAEVGEVIALYEIDEKGGSKSAGKLHAIEPSGFILEDEHGAHVFPDLPYFLDDLRPAGFLGRLIPKRFPELSLNTDIAKWSADDCLKYLTRKGFDAVGNFIMGDGAFSLWLNSEAGERSPIPLRDRSSAYAEKAVEVLNFGDPGSSAGGEQPKFSAFVGPEGFSVLVKFTPQLTGEVALRRADLLVCEHLAANVCKKYGHASAATEIVRGEEQLFLQIQRFDRSGRSGRRGLVSLRALDAEFVGKEKGWSDTAQQLQQQDIISQEDLAEIRWREQFGHLIANTDMHSGNISFYFERMKIGQVAPIYDMLPVLYSPQSEQIIPRSFNPAPPKPADADVWGSAWEAAAEFWSAVSEDERITDGFRDTAGANLKVLEKLGIWRKRLPSSS